MKIIKQSEAFVLIESEPELALLWNRTISSLPNCIIQPCSIKEYGNLTGCYFDRTDYVGSVINKTEGKHKAEYIIYLIIGPNALLADVAHEITHVYIHSRLGFPLQWLEPIYWKSPENLSAFDLASHIYSIIIHPVIDNVLKDLDLFNPIIYNRIAANYRKELSKYCKNPNSVDKNYFLINTIATQQRLPFRYWQEITSEFMGRNSFLRLQERIDNLSSIPIQLTPNSVYDYVWDMWNEFAIDTEKNGINLYYESPLLKNTR